MAIKDLIRAGRKKLGWTEQKFADALGVTRGAIQQWEKGATAPARKHQENVARLIGITVGELMTGESAQYPPSEKKPAEAVKEPTASYSDVFAEAKSLLASMNSDGQREALDFMRFLTTKYPADFSASAADGHGDTISARQKAA